MNEARSVEARAFRSNLREVRTRLGLSQQELAERAGVSRQTITSIEAGINAPSTIVALKLARALGLRVEDLFWIEGEETVVEAIPARTVGPAGPGPVTLARIDGRWVAHPVGTDRSVGADPVPADGEADWDTHAETVRVRMYCDDALHMETVVVAGCAPALSVWTRATERWHRGVRFHALFANSFQALAAFVQGEVHAAGVHLYDADTGEHNAPFVNFRERDRAALLFNVGLWTEGLFVASGNPLGIKGVEDLTRPGVTMVNREEGAGTRRLLESALAQAGIPARAVEGFDRVARSHHDVAQMVALRQADAGVGPEPVARRFGLGFIPLQEVRYDVVVWKDALDAEPLKLLIDTLQQGRMRAQLRSLGGFDTRLTGDVVARVGGPAAR